jgi:hypothetical protein
VPTILAVPAFAAATSPLLGSAAFGAWRSGIVPGWWVALSALGAAVAGVSLFGYADKGYFYPDVQQQWSVQILSL